MSVIIIGISIVYVLLIGSFWVGFDRVKRFEIDHLKPKTCFGIIVPFRNEANNLPALCESVVQLNYPKDYFEIIFVDDDSEDDSANVLHSILSKNGTIDAKIIKNIRSTNSPKKDAISLAISQTKYDWIVTTDADTVLPKYWLDSFDECIQKQQPEMIAAPITYHHTTGFLQNFQLLEVLSLQGATLGGFGIKKPFLCNGANLAYKKLLFTSVLGFEGNSGIASGDDVFLLEKAVRQKLAKVVYLKCREAIVSSSALTSTAELVEQRVRWAAKSGAYHNWFAKLTGLVILAQNALLLVGLFLLFTGLLAPKLLIYVFVAKLGIDFLLLFKAANFFDQKQHLKYYIVSALFYPFFSTYIAFTALFKGYKWKGRNYKR